MPLPAPLPVDSVRLISNPIDTRFQTRWLRYLIPLILLCLALGLLYRDGFVWLFEVWNGKAYSHGYLVPLVSLYLVWEQRERYRLLPIAPAYAEAAIVILISQALLLISHSSAFIQLEAASLFLIIPGILLLVAGRHVTRAALLPWLYLSFALPWFDLFLSSVQPISQRLTAILGTKLLSLFYPVFLSKIYIQLPSITMEVAKECSGVGFFISVLAIGVPLVYLTQRSWLKAALVLCLGLLITLLANGFRVAMAGVMGENFGPELLHGPAHILQGWLVAWFGWAGLFLVNWLIIRTSKTTTPRLCERWRLYITSTTEQNREISPKSLYSASCILIFCALISYVAFPRPVPLPAPLSSLPMMLSGWNGSDAGWLDKSPLFPGADDQLERIYHFSTDAPPVYLYVAYFNKQTEQKRLISQFSRPLHKKAVTITLPGSEAGLASRKVNRTTLVQGGIPYDVFFWYQFPANETFTGKNQARMAALKNGILHQRNNGAIVLVGIQGKSPETTIKTEIPESMSAFLNDANLKISELIPWR